MTRQSLPKGAWRARANRRARSAGRVSGANLSSPRSGSRASVSRPTLPPGAAWSSGSTGPSGGLRSARFRPHPLLQRALAGQAVVASGCPEKAAVAAVQEALAEMGHFHGDVDGVFGATTDRAVMSFQSEQGLDPNGVIESSTMEALDRRDAMRVRAPSNLPRRVAGGGGVREPTDDESEEEGAADGAADPEEASSDEEDVSLGEESEPAPPSTDTSEP